jgi:hypothetical protein
MDNHIEDAIHDAISSLDEDTCIRYRNSEGKLHNLSGPAVVSLNGAKVWYVNGRRHRLDGPACEWKDGDREWFIDGKRHRLDGPAIQCNDGDSWHVDGVWCKNFKDFQKAGKLTDDQITILILKYGEMN